MVLLTGDCDINENSLITMHVGNGDYYIIVFYKDEKGLRQRAGVRIPMSGGQATPEVKNAVSALHWAMEDAGFNTLDF